MDNVTIPNPMENISKESKEQISLTLGNIVLAICFVAIIAIPLIFVPFLSDPLEFPKQLLIFFLGIGGLLVWSIRSLFQKRYGMIKSSFDLPLLLLGILAIVSAILTPNFYASLSGETLMLVGGVCLYFLFSLIPQKETIVEKFALFLGIVGAILGAFIGIQTLYVLLNPVLKININFFLLNPGFNIAGSALAAVLFLAAVLPLVIGLSKSHGLKQKGATIPLLVLIVIGMACSAYVLFQNRPILLDHVSGWKIATGVIQTPKNALLGIGPNNTLDAFTLYKPTEFNASNFWNLRFSTSSNLYLSVLTSLGILGLAFVAFYILKFVQIARARLKLEGTSPMEKGIIGSIAVILVLGLIFPAPLLSLFLLFAASGMLMAFYRLKGVSLYSKEEEKSSKVFPVIATIVLTIVVFTTLVWPGYLRNFTLADYYFARSLEAAAKNQGKETYDLQIKALELNPYNSNYRISYSQTNLALANSLAGQANLTDEQKQTVVTLVQQAIREARAGAALAPQRASAWENLSLVYRNLINFAQGADQWAVASQNQAVQLDPTNPRLRLDLGGIFFAAGDYQNAAQIFNTAVNLKPDFANAHYNLAQALKGLGQNQLALQELQTTSTLVCAVSNTGADCVRVNAEIVEVNKKISSDAAAEATKSGQTGTTPAGPQEPLASPSGTQTNLPKAATTPAPQVGTSSGELQ